MLDTTQNFVPSSFVETNILHLYVNTLKIVALMRN